MLKQGDTYYPQLNLNYKVDGIKYHLSYEDGKITQDKRFYGDKIVVPEELLKVLNKEVEYVYLN